jgi:hypothetical protein
VSGARPPFACVEIALDCGDPTVLTSQPRRWTDEQGGPTLLACRAASLCLPLLPRFFLRWPPGGAFPASATLADGSTLIALSEVFPGRGSTDLYSLTTACALNRAFGHGGVAKITISGARMHAAPAPRGVPPPTGVLWVQTVAPRRGGGAILAGTYGDDWVVGEVTQRGALDSMFGNGGWTVLPFHGEVTAVMQEQSGRIVVAGDNNGGGCCTYDWATAVSAHGQFDRAFGIDGRETLPRGEDSGVEALAAEPNGDILVMVGGGNMGCFGVELAMLTPSGRPVPGFAARLSQFWQRLRFGTFRGDVYVDGEGFTLVGGGQRPCMQTSYSFSAPSATGVIAHFRTDGTAVGAAVRFPSRMAGGFDAFEYGAETLIVQSPYTNPTELTLTVRRLDGSLDPRFGSRGRTLIRTPWSGTSMAWDVMVSTSEANRTTLLVIATLNGHNELQLVRLHV